jgi:serine/threonine-protein kinase RsbW
MTDPNARQIESENAPDQSPKSKAIAPTPPQTVEIRIPADAEWVRVVRLAVAGVASRLKFFHDDIEDIKLAVSEACNNAILHAAAPRDGLSLPLVIIQLSPHPDRLEVVVADEGCFVDGSLSPAVGRVSPHERPTGELHESGLGLFLMQSLMDSVEHVPGAGQNTTIHMVKYVREETDAQRSV